MITAHILDDALSPLDLEIRFVGVSKNLPVVRASVGAHAYLVGLEPDAADLLRLAVDESCASLIRCGDHSPQPMSVRLSLRDSSFHVEAAVIDSTSAVPLSGFALDLVAALVEEVHTFHEGFGGASRTGIQFVISALPRAEEDVR